MSNVIERIERGDIDITLHTDREECMQDLPGYYDALLNLARIGQQMQWIPVSERLPEINQKVLLYHKHDNMVYGFLGLTDLYKIKMWFKETDTPYPCNVITHWMPLPEPPGEEIDTIRKDTISMICKERD